MAWPKRGTRKIVVDQEEFVWHYDAHCPYCSDDVFTAGKEGAPFVLFIDPLAWAFEIRPRSVAAAIRWARKGGWSAEEGPTQAIALNHKTDEFQWLAPGQRHIGCPDESPDDG